MKNILIVGGTGVLSYAIVNEAVKQGMSVTCINRGKSKEQEIPPNVNVIHADYRNSAQIERVLEGYYYDAIIDVLCYTEKDIDYSISLFKDKCSQYIFMSSCAVYNKRGGDFVCDEESELINPLWDYSINKVKCEQRLIFLASKHKFNYTIIRPAITYGNTRIPYGITPPYGYHGTLIQRIMNHKPILLWDEGQTYTTITRVEDFAIGVVGILGNEKSYGQSYNIVGDEKIKWIEVLQLLGTLLHKEIKLFNVSKEILAKEMPHRKGEILGGRGINLLIDNSKIKSVVPGMGTHIPLKEGLKMTVDYYMNHNYLKGIDYSFDGNWDRIIMKYDKNRIYKLSFVDYLKKNSIYDKVSYFEGKYSTNMFVKSLFKTKNITTRVINCFRNIFNI